MSVNSAKQRSTIQKDDWAMVTMPSGGLRVVELREGGVINLGKFGQFIVDNVFGYPYGQSFEILDDKKVAPVKSLGFGLDERGGASAATEGEDSNLESEHATPVPEMKSSANNQNLIDVGEKIQKITIEEIEQMKKEGMSNEAGKLIIEKMIQSHEAFDKKTVYSQEKYLTRKQRKFTRRFTMNYLSSSALLNYLYQEKEPQRVLDMSEETLGLMMSYANVMPGGNYLVMDEAGGLIVYAMLERMGGKGSITLVHENDQPNLSALRSCGYSEEELDKVVKTINLLQFFEPETERIDLFEYTPEELELLPYPKKQQYLRKQQKAQSVNETLKKVEEGNFDGLIYVSTLSPITCVPRMLSKVGGSRPIVIYSQFKEILVGLNHVLQKDKRVLIPNIYESRVTKFQTVPGKLHPMMTSRSGGGFISWGLRVFPMDNVIAVGRGLKKRRLNNEAEAASTAAAADNTEVSLQDSKPEDTVMEPEA
ncbi:hypothetical protein CANARDRAFT_26119 [[Candida] arabinofermentans NRRL YB-2248]|uniref:tRNA (adenine(58)-N(1))-methyltransferase non-catalytic subunit TRM6 n=1 Tax=[Candida] arabinofermentans NRRL YB-2248 TaxID=983967 RepID=A0A1E4T873_9ASCO|nr:hypothetical protein CANARDRAFT_26119 [[Candida] arabinofermentans NRRL YB-2248]